MSSLLELRQLGGGYTKQPIFTGIDLTVQRGELLCVIGPNGCGKSTLVRAITGLCQRHQGEVWLDAQPWDNYAPRARARKVSVLPQFSVAAFPFHVWEVVLAGRHPYRAPFAPAAKADEEAVERALRLTDTWDLRDRMTNQLSGGEWRRVVLARTLAQDTPLILLDEPGSSLDLGHQTSLHEILFQLTRAEGKGILCVSHDLAHTAEYADRVLVLQDGKQVALGLPEEVFTASLLREVFGADQVSVTTNPTSGRPGVWVHRRPEANQPSAS